MERAGAATTTKKSLQSMLLRPVASRTMALLDRELQPFGKAVLDELERFHLRLFVLGRRETAREAIVRGEFYSEAGERTWEGRLYSLNRCFYDARRRVLVVGEERLGRFPRSELRAEIGRAIDDYLQATDFENPGLSALLWTKFGQRRTRPVAFEEVDAESYFPLSTEAFFEASLASTMAKEDPDMHRFLSDLVAGHLARPETVRSAPLGHACS